MSVCSDEDVACGRVRGFPANRRRFVNEGRKSSDFPALGNQEALEWAKGQEVFWGFPAEEGVLGDDFGRNTWQMWWLGRTAPRDTAYPRV